MEDDGYNLVRTVRARDAERGRDLRARAGSRRVRQDRRFSATETPRRCVVGQARRLVLRAERGSAGALRPISQSGLESTEVCVWVIAEPLTERDAWAALGSPEGGARLGSEAKNDWIATSRTRRCSSCAPTRSPRLAQPTSRVRISRPSRSDARNRKRN